MHNFNVTGYHKMATFKAKICMLAHTTVYMMNPLNKFLWYPIMTRIRLYYT
jgi:hypothetical protein